MVHKIRDFCSYMRVCVCECVYINIRLFQSIDQWDRVIEEAGWVESSGTAHHAIRRHHRRRRRRPLRILFNIIWINLQAGGFHNKIVYTCQISIDFETSEIAQFNLENDFFFCTHSASLRLLMRHKSHWDLLVFMKEYYAIGICAWYVWNICWFEMIVQCRERRGGRLLIFNLCRSDFWCENWVIWRELKMCANWLRFLIVFTINLDKN